MTATPRAVVPGILLGLLLSTLTSPAPAKAVLMLADPREGLTLVWRDNFNSWNDDWSTRQTAFTEGQSCAKADPGCARVHDGLMTLSVRQDPDNPGKYLTGHVGTQGRREFSAFGYYEAMLRFPAIYGVLAGWWLQTTEDYLSDDPLTPVNERQAEIDIAECGGRPTVHHTIWYRDEGQLAGQFHEPAPHIATRMPKDTQGNWHTYGLLWTANSYTFYIDREPVGSLTEGLNERPKFPVLSIKIPDYLLDDLDLEHLKDYKLRAKYVAVWQ